MTAFSKVDAFVLALASKKHNLATDQLVIALSNTAPVQATTAVLADITQISYTNCSSRNITTTSCTQTAGVLMLVLADLVLTASGGAVGPYRYVILYNDTATNDDVIGYWDRGTSSSIANGGTMTIDLSAVTGALQIA